MLKKLFLENISKIASIRLACIISMEYLLPHFHVKRAQKKQFKIDLHKFFFKNHLSLLILTCYVIFSFYQFLYLYL